MWLEVASTASIPFKPVTIDFDDLLRYNETSHTVYREMDAALPLYFGHPSPEIDAAWADLLRFEYPAVTSEEIEMNTGLLFTKDDRHPLTGDFHAALDVFHNLHCLNAVRKELDKDYYGTHHHGQIEGRTTSDHVHNQPQDALESAQRDHIDHCMNHIRQSLQCRPDLSPAAMHVFTDPEGSKYFLGNAKQHSCYDWDSIMAWAESRAQELGYAPIP
jgi:hypothetical protein